MSTYDDDTELVSSDGIYGVTNAEVYGDDSQYEDPGDYYDDDHDDHGSFQLDHGNGVIENFGPAPLPEGFTGASAADLARMAAERERDRPHGTKSDPELISRRGSRDRAAPNVAWSAVRVIRGDEVTELAPPLRNDDAAISELMGDLCAFPGGLAPLLAPIPQGRLIEADRQRRDALAGIVAEARSRGATLEAIGRVTARPVSTVASLEVRGRALRGLG